MFLRNKKLNNPHTRLLREKIPFDQYLFTVTYMLCNPSVTFSIALTILNYLFGKRVRLANGSSTLS